MDAHPQPLLAPMATPPSTPTPSRPPVDNHHTCMSSDLLQLVQQAEFEFTSQYGVRPSIGSRPGSGSGPGPGLGPGFILFPRQTSRS
ncbi:hypothetical protein VTL71DRAFT_12392, partial [Oculimacula yallundae]